MEKPSTELNFYTKVSYQLPDAIGYDYRRGNFAGLKTVVFGEDPLTLARRIFTEKQNDSPEMLGLAEKTYQVVLHASLFYEISRCNEMGVRNILKTHGKGINLFNTEYMPVGYGSFIDFAHKSIRRPYSEEGEGTGEDRSKIYTLLIALGIANAR